MDPVELVGREPVEFLYRKVSSVDETCEHRDQDGVAVGEGIVDVATPFAQPLFKIPKLCSLGSAGGAFFRFAE